MKKLLTLSAVLSTLLICAACGTNTDSSNAEKSEPVATTTTEAATTTTAAKTTIAETTTTVPTTTEIATEVPTSAPTDSPTEAPTEAPEENREFSVGTSKIAKDPDAMLISIAEGKGLEVYYDEETLAFSAPQSKLSEIATEFCKSLNELFTSVDTSGSTIKKVVISDDYSTLDIYVTSDFTSSSDVLAILVYAQPMNELQLLSGKNQEDVHYKQNIIDIDTGEIIRENTMPDDMNIGQ